MLHRAWRTLFAALFVTSFVLVQPVSAAACDPGTTGNDGYWWVGQHTVENGHHDISGITASIEARYPYVSFDSDSSDWIMLDSTRDNHSYIQIGYLHENFLGIDTKGVFVEWDDDGIGAHVRHMIDNPASGTTHAMTIYAFPVDSTHTRFEIWYNSVLMYNVTLDFKINDSQVEGEIHNPGDQMPGSVSNHAHFTLIEFKDYQTNSWKPYASDLVNFGNYTNNSEPNWFGRTRASDWDMEIWDKRCP